MSQLSQAQYEIGAMFDRIAPRYDLLNRLLSMRQDQRWRRYMAQMLPRTPRGHYLDVATGTGDVLGQVMLEHPEYERFLGVDIAANMLKIAEQKWSQQKSAPAFQKMSAPAFQKMSASDLQLPDASFDSLTISFGIRNVTDIPRALAEFHRVLKPHGVALILEFFLPETGIFSRLFQFYFRYVLPKIGALLSDSSAYRYLPESVLGFHSARSFRALLEQSGFTVEQEKKFLWGACRIFAARARNEKDDCSPERNAGTPERNAGTAPEHNAATV